MALYLNFSVALQAIFSPLGKIPLRRTAARDETSPGCCNRVRGWRRVTAYGKQSDPFTPVSIRFL